ncbi:MAG: ATP-grasp domain-containing protein [Candidatus Moranbacteria bacterium]|nr:ATP-grasp domain-containing protein [Candidatus Moranbacteria bacterium]
MKLSIIFRKEYWESDDYSEWHVEELKKSALKKGFQVEIVDISEINEVRSFDFLGDVIFWRSSSLDKSWEKNTLYNIIDEKKLFSRALLKFPYLSYKFFQQKVVSVKTGLNFIPTYVFKTKKQFLDFISKSDILDYPLIAKPNWGGEGKGVVKLEKSEDLKKLSLPISEYVFQKFILNKGDFRILILGGRVLGIMKRKGQAGNIVNNFSRGGGVWEVKDKREIKVLSEISIEIAKLFGMDFCGVDIIKSKEDGRYYFMEVNSAPQWMGFQKATGLKVADLIVEFMKKNFFNLNFN